MNKQENHPDDPLKLLFKETQLKAPEGLQYRIMNELEVSKQRTSKLSPSLSQLSFGLYYALLVWCAVVALAYFHEWLFCILIAGTGACFLFLTLLDEKKLFKKQHQKNSAHHIDV